MSTENLIAALAADRTQEAAPPRFLLLATLASVAVAGALFFAVLGPRPDFMIAMHTWRFVGKFVLALSLAASASLLVLRASRPEAPRGRMDFVLLLAPALLLAAVIVELALLPSTEWMPRMMGHNARVCMLSIPLLSLGPLAWLLVALRKGAVTAPTRAGALAGLMAGGLGAAFYAAHCFDDSPLFVAVWYTLAVTFVTVLGAVLGKRVLRW
jgi:hypothetical protein